MKFSAIQEIVKNKNNYIDAMEAAVSGVSVVNYDDTPMQIRLINDAIILTEDLKKVDNPIMFEKGTIPTVDGLFSEYIFGTTAEERMRTFAYIDLKQKFIHPYVYEVLVKLYRNIDRLCAGEGSWKIDEFGKLLEIKDVLDPDYDETNTGLQWFIDNYHKIRFEENESLMRNERIKLLNSLSDKDIFITKWLVIPVFYRDVTTTNGRVTPHELNDKYNRLIRYVNSLNKETISFFNNRAKYAIQTTLVDIRKYGQSLIEKKNGFFKKSVLGKSIDYGARAVISTPVINEFERPEAMNVNLFKTGIPIAKCCEMGFPFVIHWLVNFFRKEFETSGKKSTCVMDPKTGEYRMEYREVGDVLSIYTQDYIHKQIDGFIHTYGTRFQPIEIPMEDGTMSYLAFTGKGYSRDPKNPVAATISERPLTWTDLLYIACVDCFEETNKMQYITRYPLEDYFGTFPCGIAVLSTTSTMPVMINGKVYPHYPVVEIGITEDVASTRFVDTVDLDNMYLDAIGGDFDGDTISAKFLFTEEANQEARENMTSVKHFVSIQGNLVRFIKNEAYLTLYNMTKR